MIQKIYYNGHEEWLQLRKRGIGGSEAGVIMGVSKFATPYTLFMDKVGRALPKEENMAMKIGTNLEQLVADEFSRRNDKRVNKRHYMTLNTKYPWAIANIDRKITCEDAILECKTTSSMPTMRDFRKGSYPDTWYCQVQHYMAVGNFKKAYIACIVTAFGGEYLQWEVDRDDDFIGVMMNMEHEFWERVQMDNPPPVSGSDDEYNIIKTLYPASDKTPAFLDSKDLQDDLKAYNDYGEQIKLYKGMQDACKERLCLAMGTSDTGYVGSKKVCTWKEQSRKTFDFKKFTEDYPNFDITAYTNISTNRVFKLSK